MTTLHPGAQTERRGGAGPVGEPFLGGKEPTGRFVWSSRAGPVGGRVSLEIAIPDAMRKHFGGQAVYAVNAVVCRVERFEADAVSRIGARFIGRS